jgi:hypothetical protein
MCLDCLCLVPAGEHILWLIASAGRLHWRVIIQARRYCLYMLAGCEYLTCHWRLPITHKYPIPRSYIIPTTGPNACSRTCPGTQTHQSREEERERRRKKWWCESEWTLLSLWIVWSQFWCCVREWLTVNGSKNRAYMLLSGKQFHCWRGCCTSYIDVRSHVDTFYVHTVVKLCSADPAAEFKFFSLLNE